MTSPEPHLKTKVRDELERIEEDCVHSGKSHFNAGDRWGRYHFWLGVPAVTLSALASTAFFAEQPMVGGLLAATVAVLTALQTFLKPSERSSAHKAAGDQYLALRNDSRVFREIRLDTVCDDQAALDGLDEFTKRRREMNLSSPQFSRRDFEHARKGIEEGEASHAVDKER